jgi:hypothetical protein
MDDQSLGVSCEPRVTLSFSEAAPRPWIITWTSPSHFSRFTFATRVEAVRVGRQIAIRDVPFEPFAVYEAKAPFWLTPSAAEIEETMQLTDRLLRSALSSRAMS